MGKKKEKHSKEKKDKHKERQSRREKEPPSQLLSSKDYFKKSVEFRAWLTSRGKSFEELTSESARKSFQKFVDKWNSGNLDDIYYRDDSTATLSGSCKSSHAWGFLKAMSSAEKSANESTRRASLSPIDKPISAGTQKDKPQERREMVHPRAAVQPREVYQAMLDDIAPKETGRRAIAEKRKTVGASLHGASKDQEQSADGCDQEGWGAVLGGGGDFHQAVKRQRQHRMGKLDAQRERLEVASLKEKSIQEELLSQLGLAPGQKVTIQPRRDSS
jgi:hypothetical protein